MLAIRVVTYAVILYLLGFHELSELYTNVLWVTFIVMLYIDAKHPDIRSLIVIFALINTVFVELDVFVFVLTTAYWPTGLVAGDLILNAIILLNLFAMAFAIFNRPMIMNYVKEKFGLSEHVYLYTRADYLQLKFIQLVIVGAVLYNLYMLYLGVLVWRIPEGAGYELEYETAKDFYKAKSYLFTDILVKVEAFRNFLVVLVLFKWLQQTIDTDGRKAF